MSKFFLGKAMWCESTNPNIQKVCKIITSEVVKKFASVDVLFLIQVRILDLLRHPVRNGYQLSKKKIIKLTRIKRPIPKVP